MNLYQACITLKDFQCGSYFYDEVRIHLCRKYEDIKKVKFTKEELKKMIKSCGCKSKRWKKDAENQMKEFFTQREIEELKTFFKKFEGSKFEYHKIKLPYENFSTDIDRIFSEYGDARLWHIWQLKNYPLDFKVEGYFHTWKSEKIRMIPASAKEKIKIILKECKKEVSEEIDILKELCEELKSGLGEN